jgi:hypothetical protein
MFDVHDVLGAGSTPAFMRLAVVILTDFYHFLLLGATFWVEPGTF